MRRRFLLAGLVILLLILLAGAAAAWYLTHDRFGGDVLGSSSDFSSTQTGPAPPSARSKIVWPMFGGGPARLHVGTGDVRPPVRLAWQANGTSLVEFPPALAFDYLYYATLSGNLIAVSTRTGKRLWTVKVGRCEAAQPAVTRLRGGTVFEVFLNRKPCRRVSDPADGLLLAIAAGRPHTVRWKRNLGASETSPLIVGRRLYIGTAQGNVYCLQAKDGKTIWRYHVGAPVKGALAYDGGRVFFGAYDGRLYALGASSGKLLWRASSASDFTGGRGRFYSTPAVSYSRVYIGSTDGKVYAFDEQTGRLVWAHGTGGYVYGSPAVSDRRVFIGSYSHVFFALDAATGKAVWTFKAGGPISGSATVVGGLVYFANLGPRGVRRTYALDTRTGKEVWHWRDGGFGAVVTDGSKLYIVGWGKVYAFKPRR